MQRVSFHLSESWRIHRDKDFAGKNLVGGEGCVCCSLAAIRVHVNRGQPNLRYMTLLFASMPRLRGYISLKHNGWNVLRVMRVTPESLVVGGTHGNLRRSRARSFTR